MNSIELFAGAGGLALGAARAGFDHEAVLEWDHNACSTLRTNLAARVKYVKEWKIVEGDVRAYSYSEHKDAEFVFGGPPCQPFSVGGKHLGQEDERNMFPEAVRAIREIRPKAFVFENVKGLLRRNFHNYFNYIQLQLTFPEVRRRGDEEWTNHLARLEQHYTSGARIGLSYNVVPQLLNAANFGVPQRRERVFMVGIRSDLGVKFSFPESTHEEDGLLHAKWVTGEYFEKHRISKRKRPECPATLRERVSRLASLFPGTIPKAWLTVRDAISDLPKIRLGETSSEIANHFYNPGARSYHGHTGSPLDEPAKTLKAGDHGVPGGENTVQLDNGSVRYFSVRECARLQTFPDDWIFQGSWTESMRQLGNAVPVLLGEVVARKLAEVLGEKVKNEAGNERSDRRYRP